MSRDFSKSNHEENRYLDNLNFIADSPVIHLEALGNHTVIINDAHTAHEVLEKRSAIYSDRPSLHFIKKVCVALLYSGSGTC